MFAPETGLGTSPTAASARFNEAGACLPRKRHRARVGQAALGRFNEAGACLPRKLAAIYAKAGE